MKKTGVIERTYVYFQSCLKTLSSCIKVICLAAVDKGRSREKWDLIIRDWSEGMLRYIQCDPVIENPGQVDFTRGEPFIIMSNHTSLYDIPVIFRAIPGSVRMVTKKELRAIPFFGKTLEILEFIYIDRKNRAQAIKDLERARDKMQSGILIWISPEGTRSASGELQKLKKGGFKLAQQTGAKIVPVSISGAFKILKDGQLSGLHLQAPVTVRINEPVDPKDFEGLENGERLFMDEVAKRISSEQC